MDERRGPSLDATLVIILLSTIAGLLLRLMLYEHMTSDTTEYLLPWYDRARTTGT